MTALERAYNEYAALPIPKLDEKHLHDRPKYQLENEAIREQIAWVARKHGVEFKDLDNFIEIGSEALFKKETG